MFLSRIELDPSRAGARDFHLLSTAGGTHKLVWQWFASDSAPRRDFLFRVEPGTPRIWTLSERAPAGVPASWRCDAKEFAPQLQRLDRLRFLVTVNPTVRAKSGTAPGKRHDVVMHEKARLRSNGERESEAVIAQRAGAAWLLSRGNRLGCVFDECLLQVQRYRVERFSRPDAPPASVAMLDLGGVLTVTEPDLFTQTLFRGIGPAKAFGCGLMLVRRA